MDMDTLAKANELSDKIKGARTRLSAWQLAGNVYSLYFYSTSKNSSNTLQVEPTPESLEALKALNIMYYTKVVADLETEFKNLLPVVL